jgi:hypothetical protein
VKNRIISAGGRGPPTLGPLVASKAEPRVAQTAIQRNIDRPTLDLHIEHEVPACASSGNDKGGKIRNTRAGKRGTKRQG